VNHAKRIIKEKKRMQFSRSKTIATAIALFLMLTIAITLVALPIANALTGRAYNTYCYIAPTPPVIGVNQEMYIVWWLNALPSTAAGAYGDRWNVYVDVMRPDGNNDTFGPLKSDSVGGSFFYYTPTQIGTYAIVCRFPGQVITGQPTPTGAPSTNQAVNDTYLGSTSRTEYFTVQQEPIPKYEETPLPSGYWTRPVFDSNRGWGNAVMGQWLGGAYYESLRTLGVPHQAGPESSHILWTRSMWSGGVMGGFGDNGYYNGVAYEGFGSPQLVLEGKAYYPVQNPPRYGWYCIDLYTGETLYYENSTDGTADMPTFGEVLDIENPNQHGGFPYLWRTSGLGTNTWEMLDGFSGKAICRIGNVSTTGTQFDDAIGGKCYINFVNLGTATAPNYYMQIWNTTEAIWWRPTYGAQPPKTLYNGSYSVGSSTSNDYWFWRPGSATVGMSSSGFTTYDGRNGYSMNVSVASIFGPRNPVNNETGSIQAVRADQFVIVGTGGRNDARGVYNGFLKAYSLKRGEWGQVLWETTFTPPKATDDFPNSTYGGGISFGGVNPEDGVFRFTESVTGKVWVYSIATGKQLWTYQYEAPWYYYGTSITFHKGRAYTFGATGVLIAFNSTTGEKLWNWSAPSIGYLEVEGYTYTPLSLSFFTDEPGHEKIYMQGSSGAAGLDTPINRASALFCVDANTGKMIWRLTAWVSRANNALSREIISEGRIIWLDNHDNQIYCLGQGSSATTVSAPQTVPALGEFVTITGTVTDNSPSGRHNVAGDLDFALKGTPAISDADMDAWMEYLYHQRPRPTNAKGVEVSLDAIDPNNNYVHIGTATSDSASNFGFAWKPEVPGTYQIIATFAGSAAYGPSYSTTYMTVGEAPPTPTEPQPAPVQPPLDMYILYATIAIIVAVGVATVLLLRKGRP
jgi:outer membrane protein assembly factor BamB